MSVTAMSTEEIATKFAEAAERFPAITGQPRDQDVQDLRELVYGVLLDIPYDLQQTTRPNLSVGGNPSNQLSKINLIPN